MREHREWLLRNVAPPLERLGLLVPTWRAYERVVGAVARGPVSDGGLAVPPAYLRMLVAGTPSASAFLESGRLAAESIRAMLAPELVGTVLDFGCGCGRVARWWRDGPEWHGCDINPRLTGWCAGHLPHLRVSTTPLEPPTLYHADRFDAIYAISVFTHWPEPLQHAWMSELRRILAPGGRLLFTTHGEAAARGVLFEDEMARFERGEFVTRFGEDAGSNLCSAFHPDSWTREQLLADAEIVAHKAGGAPGLGNQDLWLIR